METLGFLKDLNSIIHREFENNSPAMPEKRTQLFLLESKSKTLKQNPTNKILSLELYLFEVKFVTGNDLPQNVPVKF